MARRRHVGATQHLSAGKAPPRGGTLCHTQWRCDGQPERQNQRKRGVRGYDGFKKVNGRKRHLLVDTQGLVLKVVITPAQVHDTVGARELLSRCGQQFPRLGIIWADQAYRGPLEEWVAEHHKQLRQKCRLEIVVRSNAKQRREQVLSTVRKRQSEGASTVEMWSGLSWQGSMEKLPRRWVVERTFAWLGKSRRLCRDYEQLPQTGEAWIYIAMTRLMLRRLGKIKASKPKPSPS